MKNHEDTRPLHDHHKSYKKGFKHLFFYRVFAFNVNTTYKKVL